MTAILLIDSAVRWVLGEMKEGDCLFWSLSTLAIWLEVEQFLFSLVHFV
jgi:hypothetical protein